MIIAISGIDGVGKTTIAKELVEMLTGSKYVKFPDRTTPTGQVIDQMLRDKRTHDPVTFQALNVVNRLEHISEIMEAKGLRTNHLVCDRYLQDAFVYGGQDGLDEDWLKLITGTIHDADLHVLLTMDPVLVDSDRLKGRDREVYEQRGVQGLLSQALRFKLLWDQHRGNPRWVEYETSTFSPARIASAIACDVRDLMDVR
jgi:dTMP kinase